MPPYSKRFGLFGCSTASADALSALLSANDCTCEFGSAAIGAACVTDGAAICATCDSGFILIQDACISTTAPETATSAKTTASTSSSTATEKTLTTAIIGTSDTTNPGSVSDSKCTFTTGNVVDSPPTITHAALPKTTGGYLSKEDCAAAVVVEHPLATGATWGFVTSGGSATCFAVLGPATTIDPFYTQFQTCFFATTSPLSKELSTTTAPSTIVTSSSTASATTTTVPTPPSVTTSRNDGCRYNANCSTGFACRHINGPFVADGEYCGPIVCYCAPYTAQTPQSTASPEATTAITTAATKSTVTTAATYAFSSRSISTFTSLISSAAVAAVATSINNATVWALGANGSSCDDVCQAVPGGGLCDQIATASVISLEVLDRIANELGVACPGGTRTDDCGRGHNGWDGTVPFLGEDPIQCFLCPVTSKTRCDARHPDRSRFCACSVDIVSSATAVISTAATIAKTAAATSESPVAATSESPQGYRCTANWGSFTGSATFTEVGTGTCTGPSELEHFDGSPISLETCRSICSADVKCLGFASQLGCDCRIYSCVKPPGSWQLSFHVKPLGSFAINGSTGLQASDYVCYRRLSPPVSTPLTSTQPAIEVKTGRSCVIYGEEHTSWMHLGDAAGLDDCASRVILSASAKSEDKGRACSPSGLFSMYSNGASPDGTSCVCPLVEANVCDTSMPGRAVYKFAQDSTSTTKPTSSSTVLSITSKSEAMASELHHSTSWSIAGGVIGAFVAGFLLFIVLRRRRLASRDAILSSLGATTSTRNVPSVPSVFAVIVLTSYWRRIRFVAVFRAFCEV